MPFGAYVRAEEISIEIEVSCRGCLLGEYERGYVRASVGIHLAPVYDNIRCHGVLDVIVCLAIFLLVRVVERYVRAAPKASDSIDGTLVGVAFLHDEQSLSYAVFERCFNIILTVAYMTCVPHPVVVIAEVREYMPDGLRHVSVREGHLGCL